MDMDTNTGILGIGIWLPDMVRRNDAWPQAIVAQWQATRARRQQHHNSAVPDQLTTGEARVVAAMAAIADDPFQGSRERRVLDQHMTSSAMEAAACQRALDDAGIEASQIDFLLGFSAVPDHLGAPNVCAVHRQLGLRKQCLALNTDASFNSYSAQMEVASGWIGSGIYRYGLLYQSSALSRLLPMNAHFAPWLGDGATAVVVGAVPAGWGLLGSAHCTDGRLSNAMMAGVPGRSWYESGKVRWYPGCADAARTLFLGVADRARDVVSEALQHAGVEPHEVDFLALHQPAAWFRQVVQEHVGLHNARSLDTFASMSSVGAANVPIALGIAQRMGLLDPGDIVVTHSGGLGVTWASQVLRWGQPAATC